MFRISAGFNGTNLRTDNLTALNPYGNKPVGIYVNSTLKANVTTMDYYGNFSLTLNLPSANNKPTEYNIQAAFEGDSPSNATAYAHTPNGTQYAVCTTIQYGYKPSSNVTVLIVKPQSTDMLTTTKTMEQMQKDAGSEGLEVWGPDSWCLWPPFFKLHARVTVDSSGANVQNWVGLFACGVDSYSGLTLPLQKALQGLTDAERDIAVGAITSVTAGVASLYWLNMISAGVSVWSIGAYFAQMGLYALGMSAAISVAYFVPYVWLSRALLYGIGFALLALTIGAFSNDPQARIFPSILRMQLLGADPITTAIKGVLNSFLTCAITASNMLAASIIMINPLMWPFALITLAAAVTAIYLGSTR